MIKDWVLVGLYATLCMYEDNIYGYIVPHPPVIPRVKVPAALGLYIRGLDMSSVQSLAEANIRQIYNISDVELPPER